MLFINSQLFPYLPIPFAGLFVIPEAALAEATENSFQEFPNNEEY